TGVMETHDEETRKFFKHSSVMCVLAPRYASSKMSFFKQQDIGIFELIISGVKCEIPCVLWS
ncbi:phospholipase D Delta-like, partial [Trifolium medium]|nr:phospholipase D Delta-like [Trifolium medium]